MGKTLAGRIDPAGRTSTASLKGLARLGRTLLLAGMAACGSAAHALDVDLGNAAAYSGFFFEDATGLTSSLGRIAVGGNVSFTQTTIGSGAPAVAGIPSLVVRGNITAYAGGALWSGSLPGFGQYVGTRAASVPASLDLRKVTSLPVNFDTERVYLNVMSEQLRDLPASGQASTTATTLTLTGGNRELEVFSLTAADVAAARTVSLSNVSPTAHLVINLRADAVRRLGFAINTTALAGWKGRVLFNAHDAETLQFNQLTFWGSVLAPNACICNSTGRLEGSVVARKWSASMIITHTPFVPSP
jgi:choice-of-anchor A domain-containing protein